MINTGCPANNRLFKVSNHRWKTEHKSKSFKIVQDMNGTYNGNGDAMGETVINHIDSNTGMLRKDNSPIFRRPNMGECKVKRVSILKLSKCNQLKYLYK